MKTTNKLLIIGLLVISQIGCAQVNIDELVQREVIRQQQANPQLVKVDVEQVQSNTTIQTSDNPGATTTTSTSVTVLRCNDHDQAIRLQGC